MSAATSATKRIAVIGGGISGLAAAHRVLELAPEAEVVLFEASERLGGVIRTVRQDGFLIEQSADSFITTVPAAVNLCRRIGFADQLIPTEPAHRGAMVVARGKLERVPEGFVLMSPKWLGPIMRSPILSWRGKLRLACERFVPPRTDQHDESVAGFARRRLGREAFERLVQPLVGGIYTADPEKLSLAATLPRYLEMERQWGSLRRAVRARRKGNEQHPHPGPLPEGEGDSGARYSMFVAPREGMSSLVEAIAARLPAGCVRLNAAVQRVERASGQWSVVSGQEKVSSEWLVVSEQLAPGSAGGREQPQLFDGVILATSAAVTGKLLRGVNAELAREVSEVEYAGSAIVVLGYDRSQIAHPLDSFGFVVPAIERRKILSASFSSVKFPGRAPEGKVLIRVFLGGALQPEMLALSDDQLRRTAEEELRDLLGISGSAGLSQVFRWLASMPQYHLGHLWHLQYINQHVAELPGLALAGNAYEGVGIPQCIKSGEEAAERIFKNDQ
ncbi:MAG TPA: protoporphyrinogen oxidase [Pirellulales bacterium]|nr:protoporphyrinogen oxidase [Pirellulales bacterium]